jgi:hypothetical protein
MAQILLFNVAPEKRRKLLVLALKLGAICREVPSEDFGRTLASLTGRAETTDGVTDGATFYEEMLVLDGLRDSQLNALLAGLRRERAAVALKAVVTEQNLEWTPARLVRELAAGHAALHGGGKSVHETK